MTEGDLLEIGDEPILNEGLNNNEGNNQQTDTYLNSTNLIKYYGGNQAFSVCLYDSYGNVLSNKNINFTINGATYTRSTNNNGIASLSINLNPGNYTITSLFNGNDNYKSCNATNWVFVNSTIYADDLVKIYHNSSQYYSLFFSVNGVALANTNVTFNINGVFYTRMTNATGWARLNINLYPGEYIITATNPVNGEVHSNLIIVLSSLYADDLYMGYQDGSRFECVVLDSFGNPYPNQNVIFNINGALYTRTSNIYGVAGLNINLGPGEYIITTQYDDLYISNMIYISMGSVSHKTYNIIANDFIIDYSSPNPYFTAKLIDNYNNNVAHKSILLSVGNNNYTSLTNDDGEAKWLIDWDGGSYNVTLSFKSYHNNIVYSVNTNIYVGGHVFADNNLSFFDTSNVTINLVSNFSNFYYSFDNITWNNAFDNISILFMNGNWDIYYCNNFNDISHYSFVVDNNAPITFANIGSGIYTQSFWVNLTAIDNTDDNPLIYYSINNSPYSLYNNNTEIFISNIYNHTRLSFYSIDKYNHQSEIININYFFNVHIANLNSGKTYSNIITAINDIDTNDGDVIEVYNFYSNESLFINKSITLKSTNSIFNYTNGNNIHINVDNVRLIDFNITSYNAYGNAIDIFASNCTLLNCIINCFNVFSCVNIVGDDNKLFLNHLINTGNYSFYLNSTKNTILKNNIFNSNNGSIIYNSNYTYLYNNSFVFNHYNCKLILSSSFNNDIYANNLTVGINLFNSGNNTFHSNWIYNKPKSGDNTSFLDNYHLININCPGYSNNFYLNYIHFDYYKAMRTHNVNISAYSHVDLSNNWWGDTGSFSLIDYKRFKDITMESNIVLNIEASSYYVRDGLIYGVNITCYLTYNHKGTDLSSKGYLPDNIPIKFENQTNSFIVYLSHGSAYQYFDINTDISNFIVSSEYISKSLSINRTACASIHVISSALYNNSYLNFNYNLYLNDSVDWISLVSHNLNNFTDELDLIINGIVVKNFTITNSAYNYFKSQYRNEVFNAIHMYNDFLYNPKSNIKAQFYVYTALTYNIFDLNFAMDYHDEFLAYDAVEFITSLLNISWKNLLLDLVMDYYNLNNNEKNFVTNHYNDFHDTVYITIEYPGDTTKKYTLHDENNTHDIIYKGNNIIRSYDISYINGGYLHTDSFLENKSDSGVIWWIGDNITCTNNAIEGHYVNSDYDALETFTFVNTKLNEDILSYWLNQKDNYPEGFMKASYGSFLNGFLTLYCVDLIANIGSSLFNVTWNRNTPIAISVRDDYNKTILSGECSFRFGMDVFGDDDNVRAFNFLVSSSFSQIEYWVMNALFPGSSTYGSVTYGLGTLLLNGSSLEVIFEEGFVVIREKGSNMRILVIDLSTGMVCDVFDLNLQGSYCYSNQQTEWAYDLGEALLNSTNIFDILVNYFNNINNTFNYIQDIISGAFESIDDFLDSMDNNFLGIVGTIAITVGITALLMSNPAGWVILGGIALVTLGGILTYYSDDLNKGWTYERGAWFLFDIAISIPFGVYKSGFIVGEIIIKEYSFSNTKYVIMYSDDAFEVLSKYSLITTINYEPYGTLKSIIASAYGTTNFCIIPVKIFYYILVSNGVHRVISCFMDNFYNYLGGNYD